MHHIDFGHCYDCGQGRNSQYLAKQNINPCFRSPCQNLSRNLLFERFCVRPCSSFEQQAQLYEILRMQTHDKVEGVCSYYYDCHICKMKMMQLCPHPLKIMLHSYLCQMGRIDKLG